MFLINPYSGKTHYYGRGKKNPDTDLKKFDDKKDTYWTERGDNWLQEDDEWDSDIDSINKALGVTEISNKPICEIDKNHKIYYVDGPFGCHRGRWNCRDCGDKFLKWRSKNDE